MIKISVCICTKDRHDRLLGLLDSLEKMQIPADVSLSIIIVENDIANRSQKLVEEYSAESKLKINYYLETRRGLVYARNKSVREAGGCDFICFTDDDEIVTPIWLVELLRCQREFNADAVAGPTYPIFNKRVPEYIMDFHTPRIPRYGEIIDIAFTGCLLIRKSCLDRINGPFNEKFNLTGGEDIYMTHMVSESGGVIRYNPDAIAYEIFPPDRANIRYVLRRAYRNSNTGLYVRSFWNVSHYKIKVLPKLFMRFFYGLIIAVPLYIYGGNRKLDGLIKIVNSVGGFQFLLGRSNRFYK